MTLSAQTIVQGRVTIEDDPDASGVTVLAMNPKDSTVVAFALTDPGGLYEISISSPLPQLLLSAFRMDTERQSRLIDNRSQEVDFTLRLTAYDLKEVLVTAPTVYRQGDTISYVVSKLAGAHDEVMSDVLAKVPGMRVKDGGMLEYLGRDVSTVMIEGIDLTQGGYGLITENIKPKDISAVEILQSFQKVRALQKKQQSDDVAVNLKLSNKSKGIWSGAADLYAGYGEGFRSRDKVTAQYFTKSAQHLLLGYFDNTGRPRADQLRSPLRMLGDLGSFVTGSYSAPTDLSEEAYLDNTTGYLSQSSAFVPRDSVQLKIQTHYTYNLLRNHSDRITSYVDPTVDLTEMTRLTDRRHEAMLEGDYEVNRSDIYLQDHLALYYADLRRPGDVTDAEGRLSEQLSHFRGGGLTNSLRFVHSRGRFPYELQVDLGYDKTGERFSASPIGVDPIAQELRRDRLSGSGSLSLVRVGLAKHLYYRPVLSVEGSRYRFLESSASTTIASMEAEFQQKLSYESAKLSASLTLPLNFIGMKSSIPSSVPLRRWFLTPAFTVEWKPSFRWTIDGDVRMDLRPGSASLLYPGTLHLDYRTLRDTESVNPHANRLISGYGRVTYSDIFNLLSLFVRGRFLLSHTPYISDLTLEPERTLITLRKESQDLRQLGLDFQLSKGFGWKSLSVILDLSLDRSDSEVMNSGTRMPYRSSSLLTRLRLSLAPVKAVTLEYACTPLITASAYGDEAEYRSFRLRQQLRLYWTLTSDLYLMTQLDHSLLKHPDGRGESLLLHAGLSWRASSAWQFDLVGDNLLNASDYSAITYTDFGRIVTRYPLRPRTLLLRTIFNF